MKLNCVLLVDDNAATNLIHSKMIAKYQVTNNVIICSTGEEALKYLTNCNANTDFGQKAKNMPDLLLLDINMPGMSGWDFIEEYKKIDFTGYQPMIFMLTTSFNPDDKFKADADESIQGFLHKPLTGDTLKRVVQVYFEEKMLDNL